MKNRIEIYEQIYRHKYINLLQAKGHDKAMRIANIYAVKNTNKAFLNQTKGE